MQESSSQQLQPPTLRFSAFLATLFPALDKEGVRFCVLRSYEGFPAYNVGNDVDLLIHRRDLPRAMSVLLSLENIRLINYTELSFIASVFLEGISSTPGARSLQVDFWWSLDSRGPEYLSADAVLQAARPRQAGGLSFLAPSPAHEAISLCSLAFYGGFLKEKYFPKVQQTFVSERSEVLAALQPAFGIQVATRLVDAVTEGDRRKILGLIRPLRVALNLRCLLREPLRGIIDTARYYLSIFRNRFSPKYIETVCILGLGDCGQAAIIDGLIPMLHSAAKVVDKYQFWLRPTFRREPSEINGSLDSRVGASSRSLSSMVNAVQWLLREWKNQFLGRMELTLRFVEDCGQRLSVDPENYSYHGPVWFARLLGKLFPSPDLWILLDPVGEGLQSRDGKISPAETLRQLEAYRSFVRTKKSMLHSRPASQSPTVTEEAYAAIIEMLAQRTETGYSRNRFQSLKESFKLKIVILGPDGAGKSSVIDGLLGKLNQGGHVVKMRHLKPRIAVPLRGEPVTINPDPHGKTPRSAMTSVAKIVVWLLEEWYANFFQDKKEALLICDRYYHDLLVDPIRYRYGGPMSLAQFIGTLMPRPGLWVLLDAPAESLQARKQEVPAEETARQRQAYLSLVRKQRKYVIVDASQPLGKVIADVASMPSPQR